MPIHSGCFGLGPNARCVSRCGRLTLDRASCRAYSWSPSSLYCGLVSEARNATALSEQRQVVCVGRSKRRPKRRLGREGAPLGQRGGAPLFVNLAGDEMALLIEMVVDLGMN